MSYDLRMISTYPSDKQDKFMLRLPDGMRDKLKEAAMAAGRSMNAEIAHRLEASFDHVKRRSSLVLEFHGESDLTIAKFEKLIARIREEIPDAPSFDIVLRDLTRAEALPRRTDKGEIQR
tara:strand:+ start:1362 stop:1721 length:360 start_codon:yes stop_codon:yes gene_type:complete